MDDTFSGDDRRPPGERARRGSATGALGAAWDEHRLYVYFAGGLFAVGVAIGAAMLAAGIDLTELFAEMLAEEFSEEFAEEDLATEEPDFTATFFIVQNTPPFLMAIVGAVTLGTVTALIMIVNGILVGNLAAAVGSDLGYGPTIALLAPHGIFELPALFVAAGVGFRLLHRAIQRILGSREALFTRAYLYRTGLLVVVAWLVLVLAAFIEAYLTLPIAEALFPDQLENGAG
ncbi:stage II sporulation protein M [Natrialbaceae archaeon AArc-T1-2]|uniref:stage II sporulation protein M n=1 Tax=Natrialbaceae archaeon AArc-T1-2 TaxID=3053904 RepID=UPI00255AF9FE|nr:stage II sporulation protein M [Natrialbaceae archaeon AArc-T1-2]WIV67185.1 stage II sporulation protein M [Natrialbaceae archaeon AArc-T1-2]